MRAAVHLTLMAIVGVAVVLAVIAGTSPRPTHFDLNSGLFVSTRDNFAVCVEVAAVLRPDRAALVDRLDSALETVRRHRDWVTAGLGTGKPSVTLGCPTAEPPANLHRAASGDWPARHSAEQEPSPYRLWMYVLDDAAADQLLGRDANAASAAAEYMAVGDDRMAEVSTAVFVRAGYLADPAFAGNELTAAAGLRPPGAEPASPPDAK
jgi:hypothetical protein